MLTGVELCKLKAGIFPKGSGTLYGDALFRPSWVTVLFYEFTRSYCHRKQLPTFNYIFSVGKHYSLKQGKDKEVSDFSQAESAKSNHTFKVRTIDSWKFVCSILVGNKADPALCNNGR